MQSNGGIVPPLDPLIGNLGLSTGANQSGQPHVSSLTVDLGNTSKPYKPTADTHLPPKAVGLAPSPSPPLAAAPKTLTNPYEPSVPGGHDNINDDLIVSVNDIFENSPLGTRYVVHDMLGQGTFGQVFKCSTQDDAGSSNNSRMVAVKVIKNQAAYYHQARVEIGVLQFLNTRGDPSNENHIVRLKDFFLHRNHLCLVFELLNLNLFELIRHNRFRGLSLPLVRVFLSQILKALAVLNRSNIIHCDIKPENILLTDATSGEVKLIDFGSACFSSRTVYTYIQSRFYRSPEVVLGHQYTMSVDMWSLGCVAAELFLGLPLFPAACELDLLQRIVETIGTPPDYILDQSKNTAKFFTSSSEAIPSYGSSSSYSRNYGRQTTTRLKTCEEYTESTGQKAPQGKQYFQHKALADIINAYPYRQGLNDGEIKQERARRESFTDFLLGLLNVDPVTRWTPGQAQKHPFITGGAFTGPFQPIPDSLRTGNATSTTPNISVQTGIPMSIPQPRVVHTTAATATTTTTSALDSIAAAVVASSPQMHAQAHAAAMAAVQMQMNMQQQQQARSIPIYNDISGNASAGHLITSSSSPYIAAHSLQRIMDPPLTSSGTRLGTRTSSGSGGGVESSQYRVGSFPGGGGHSSSSLLPMSFFSPPSRSFGVHLQSMASQDQLPPASYDPGYSNSPHRIMPLMHLPAGREQPDASPIPFQPSSVSTYRSTLAAAAAAGANANYTASMLPTGRQQQYQQQQYKSSTAAARKEPLQRTAGFVVPTNNDIDSSIGGAGASGSGELAMAEAMSIPIEDSYTPIVSGPLADRGEISIEEEEASPPENQQQEDEDEEDLPNPDADWDPLFLLTEEESFDQQRSTSQNAQSSPLATGEEETAAGARGPGTSTIAAAAPAATTAGGMFVPAASPKDSSLALAAQHLTQIQPLSHLPGVSASWPIGATGVGGVKTTAIEVQTTTTTAADVTGNPQPCSPRSPRGSLMEGISHAENMMWSPPRTAVATILKSLPDGIAVVGQQQQQYQQLQQPPPPPVSQLEPLQRLHGFVVSADPSQEAGREENEKGNDDDDIIT